MDYEGRGWREERTVWAENLAGDRVPVTTGIMIDRHEKPVAMLGVGDAPGVILQTAADGAVDAQLRINIAATIADLSDVTHRRGRR